MHKNAQIGNTPLLHISLIINHLSFYLSDPGGEFGGVVCD